MGIGLLWFAGRESSQPPPVEPSSKTAAPAIAKAPINPPVASPEYGPSQPNRQTPAVPTERLYATTTARLRAGPGTSFPIVGRVTPNHVVDATEANGDWRRVTVGGLSGWVHAGLLSATVAGSPPTALAQPQGFVAPAPPRQQPIAPVRRGGEPIRGPYVGRCDCPYDLMRNGRMCGGRSAYSRPGGRNPVCYE
ncbi:SH3 domain-containing protein [Mesorhizobium sp. BR1-1-16]|uniref:SH3 domain-containing protein n=1 Tax=Mesorhizobium sp. BR1-1-16 TaxID=2876653 RepID=UPI001CC9FE4C|nr:SH3 domain-containing protein [Mesorhizobium sp. BR1-1-16]